MTDIWTRVNQVAAQLGEEGVKAEDQYPIIVQSGALNQVAGFLFDQSYQRVSIVADANTYEIAGKALEKSLADKGISTRLTIIQPNEQGDVIADEVSLIQLIMDLQQYSAQVVVAAGSGTLHDISRYSAYTAGIPFISVPTAPSVDGFNSKGAPIIIRGEKKTIAAIGPDAIFADLDILVKAPSAMVAAGFGDMLGKYTSLFDWKFGSLVAGEPYSPLVAALTRNALQKCVDHLDSIAERGEEGIRTLIEALIESGIAMMILGQSHPASGAEHHLSHYWEMEYIRLGKRQLLHGAKVGVACVQIATLYHQLAESGVSPKLASMEPKAAADESTTARQSAIINHWPEIQEEIGRIPQGHALREMLLKLGGPTTPEQLGVGSELLARSLQEAHHIRLNRFTLLRAYNEILRDPSVTSK
ncbi:sn-glycerol-1-phosphate dehydrogenase [Paenibacillus periandrae]|uniref:sn-glycerol-1-phosphate dehydrogenase n=1 Tax=Paenibacillus periandrae TaxID=1761741 RepID=UPI001F0916BF|nr:sn-glycerol-1-phosphate dehydrogenase [Paenibacillus periandrae]